MPDTTDMKKALREAFMQGANVGGFGEANEFVSDSNAVKEDKLKADLRAGFLAGAGIKGSLKDLPKGKTAVKPSITDTILKAAGAPREMTRGQEIDPFGKYSNVITYKEGGKVSKSGRSYRGYGKARIPS